jgi:hypothetical protein
MGRRYPWDAENIEKEYAQFGFTLGDRCDAVRGVRLRLHLRLHERGPVVAGAAMLLPPNPGNQNLTLKLALTDWSERPEPN